MKSSRPVLRVTAVAFGHKACKLLQSFVPPSVSFLLWWTRVAGVSLTSFLQLKINQEQNLEKCFHMMVKPRLSPLRVSKSLINNQGSL